jgi:bifunctional DNA-binding transcriptional regulator/antitoxin component of YhaV-PrlF toxin-antitoxin module
LDRARKALGLKENEALLVFTDGEKEFAVATDVH